MMELNKGKAKIYYARSLVLRETEQEQMQLKFLQEVFEVINPALEKEGVDDKKIMEKCINMLSKCNALVFADVAGYVSKGVYTEIEFAKSVNMPMFYLKGTVLRKDFSIEIFDAKDWRVRFAKIKTIEEKEIKIKTYQHKLLEEREKSIHIEVSNKKQKDKPFNFWIPKSVIIKLEIEVYKNEKTNERIQIVNMTMEQAKYWQYTFRKIQENMEKKGISVKQWHGKKVQLPAERFLEEEK